MKERKIPFNLQFFAEPEPTPESEPTPTQAPEPEISAEERLEQLIAENARLKKASDKACSEAADYKKQLRAKQTADEAAAQEKAEKEAAMAEQFNQLQKENQVSKLEKNFLALGYSSELANKAAIAQYENDTDALFKIHSDFKDSYAKSLESEWLKNRPEPQNGTGEGGEENDPFTKGFNSET